MARPRQAVSSIIDLRRNGEVHGYRLDQAYNQLPQAQQGGFLRDFINSGFSRTTEKGAGYGMGDDLINRIF